MFRVAAPTASASVPLVLHGGSGIPKHSILEAVKNGISKINVGTALRQAYEAASAQSAAKGQQAVYETMVGVLKDEFEVAGSADVLTGGVQ